MTTLTPRDALEVVRNRLLTAADDFDRLHDQEGWKPTADLLREAAQALVERTGEPVAWVPIQAGGNLPEVGDWALLLTDTHAGPRPDLLQFFPPKPRYAVIPAQLRHVDDEGCAIWQRWSLASGHPCGIIEGEIFWQPLPPPIPPTAP